MPRADEKVVSNNAESLLKQWLEEFMGTEPVKSVEIKRKAPTSLLLDDGYVSWLQRSFFLCSGIRIRLTIGRQVQRLPSEEADQQVCVSSADHPLSVHEDL